MSFLAPILEPIVGVSTMETITSGPIIMTTLNATSAIGNAQSLSNKKFIKAVIGVTIIYLLLSNY